MADNPIKVKAYGKILSFPAGTAPEAIESALAEHEHVLNPDYKAPQPEALDYAKGFASGANKLVSGAGFLMEAAGAKETGKAVRAFGDRGAKYWNDKMSKGGKLASESQVFVDDDNEDSVTGIKLSDDWGKALLMGASESLPSMFAAAIPGVAVTKGIQVLAKLGLAGGAGATIPLLAGTAAPVGVTSNIIARVPSAVGFGAAEGVTAGAMNAADFKTSIEGMTDEELNKSPVYRALKEEHDPATARSLLAEQAALDLFGKTAVSTGTIGALTGGGALSQAYQKVTTGAQSGILGTMLKGAGTEALQETPQSGGEKFIENLTTQKFLDPNQSTTEGVLAAAASGGAIGAFTGGVVGAGGAINITPDRRAQVLNEKRKIAEMKADAINTRTMEESAAEIGAAQDIDQALAAATRATTKPVVSANEVLRSEDPTLADIEKLTGLKPTEAIDTAIAEIENQIINQPQETEDVSNQETQQAPTTQASVLNEPELLKAAPVTSRTTAEVEGIAGRSRAQADIKAAVKTAENTSASPVLKAEVLKAKGIKTPYDQYLKEHPNRKVAASVDLKNVEGTILKGLESTGKFDKKTRETYAAPFREFYKVNAERQGILPSELYERLPLKFSGKQEGRILNQDGKASPAARNKVNFDLKDATPDDFTPERVSDLLNRNNWAILTAANPMGKSQSDAQNIKANEALKKELADRGLAYEVVQGRYPGDTKEMESYLVYGVDRKTANELGNKYKQDSVLTREGLIHSNGKATPVKSTGKGSSEGYTRVPRTGAKFAFDLDWSREATAAEGALSLVGRHYSKEQRAALEGARFGQGYPGNERDRIAESDDPRLKSRVDFYVDIGNGVTPESGLGSAVHETLLHNIYDGSTNPREFKYPSDRLGGNVFEKQVLDAGYDGYYIVQGKQGRVVMLGDAAKSIPIEDNNEQRESELLAQSPGKDTGARESDGSLKGLPRQVGQFKAASFRKAQEVAKKYMKAAGLEYNPPTEYVKVNEARAKRIAQAFDEMKHEPQNPEVKAAYDALVKETTAQYKAVVDSGLKVEFIDFDKTGDPYEGSPRAMTEDVRSNNHMWVFSTRDGFGSSDFDPADNPLLAETEFEISGQKALVNDLFRVVHDYFGHVKEGVGFRAAGEENAWMAHMAMFSPLAGRALTTETRGQNSWVNYGPFAEHNRTASGADTKYADQKIGLLPEWASTEGRADEGGEYNQSNFYSALEREIPNLKKIANKNGEVSVDQAKAWINSRQKEGKFKQAEVEAVGLLDWLDTLDGKVPVADVENFVRENGVRVEEVILEGEGESEIDEDQVYDEAYQDFTENYDGPDDSVYDDAILDTAREMLQDHSDERWGLLDLNGEDEVEDWLEGGEVDAGLITEMLRNKSDPEEILGEDTYNEIRADAEQSDWENQQDYYMDMARERMGADNTTGGTEFQDYVLRGGDTEYKELLMTLPNSKAKFNAPHFDRAQDAGAENIFAHTRINEREMDAELTPEQAAEKEAYDAWEAGNNTPEIKQILKDKEEAGREYRVALEKWKERMVKDTSISDKEYEQAINTLGSNPPEELKPFIARIDEVGAKVKALQEERLAVKPKEPSTSGAKERVLFIEEIQSDWAQKGRDEGFASLSAAERKELAELDERARELGNKRSKLLLEGDEAQEQRVAINLELLEANKRREELRDKVRGRVPIAPFVTDTKAWTALVVKRLLRYAAENGFDRIAWTTGAQQAERYRLSKFVEKIMASRSKDGKYYIRAEKEDGSLVIADYYEENKLAGTIGKELAEKIIKQPEGDHVYEGLDLDVGGQGMREFYDRIVPSVVNDVAKKLGGGKVEIVSMGGQAGRVVKGLDGKILITYPNGSYLKNRNTGVMTESQDRADGFESVEEATRFLDRYEAQNLDEPGRQMSLRITPALKEKVMQGLPLFQQDRAGFNPRTFTISLMDGSDLSSVIHEGGHFYLEALAEMASQPNAPEQIVNDFDTTLQWFGIGEQVQETTDAATRTQGYPTTAGEPVATFRKADDMKAHPRYAEAKAGDDQAAFDLVSDLVTKENLNEASTRFAGATFVPVSMIDKNGANRIPTALAYHYANAAEGSVSDSIFESRKAYHTGMNAMERLVSRADFSGKVEPGRKYVLVDDVTTVGSTLADLASYIQENGGEVIGSVLLANATRSGNMFANVKTLKRLEAQYGNEIRELFNIEPSALTQEEAQYLIGFRNADELRSSAVKAQGSRLARIHARKISKGQSSVDQQRLRDIWQSMSLEQKRPYHEQWAQSFERYALEGKAPSKEMQSVFDRFQEWMLDVYKSLKEFLKQNPLAGKLNDEVRGVFDRLLATEQDIAKSREAPTKERSLKNGERAKQLERKLREQGYDFTITAKDVRDFAAGDKGKEIEANTAEKIAGIFGRKIVWIDAQGDYDINGVVVPSIKDTIFIDVNTDKAAHAVMGHELSHHLEHDNPDVYDDLLDALSTVIKDHQDYAKKYGIEGVRKDDITKEIVGDIMGDNFTRPEFWNRVAEASPSTFKSIADSIIKWLKNLILKAKSRGLGSDQWVTDSQKAQDILAKAIAKYEGLNDSVAEDGAKFHKVWHGSPHDHSKFDSAKIGTGEGAQAYGYGHYFADRREVAEFYKEQLSDNTNGPPERFFRGERLTPGTPEYHAATLLSRNNIGTLKQARNEVANWIAEDAGDPRMSNVVEGWRATLDFLNKANSKKDFTEKPYRGKLYEVELAPEQEDYLLWDKPLSEQSEKVKEALKGEDGEISLPQYWSEDNTTGGEYYKNLAKADGDEWASNMLHSLGIRGIKYLDGTSRSKGEGAYNYVVFDDKDIEITAKFSKKPEPFDPNTDIPETLPRKAQRLTQDAFNRFTVIKDWLKKKGVTLSEKADVYQAEERYHSLVANQLEDFREQKRNPLIEKIAKAGFTMADVSDFLEAQHAAEANAAIQKISNNDTDTAYGITDKEAADYLAKADPKLATLANELRNITEESKQMRLKAGLLSQEEVDAWESTYEHYIPVKGDADAKGGTGKGLKVNFKTKRRLGHGRRDEAVIENIFLDHERAIMQVEKNRVAKHLVMMAAEMQMPEIMTVGQPVKRKTLRNTTAYEVKVSGVTRSVFNNKQAADMFKQLLPDLDKGVSPNDVTVEQTKDQRIVAMASPMLAENEINAYIDGHAIRVQINDDLLARAYAKLGVTGFSALVSAGRAFNGYLSKVYTGYNPEFILTNMIRDFTSGLINLTGEEGIKMAAKTSGNYVKSFSSLMRYAVSNGKKSDKWIDMYRANGGNTGAAYLSDLERLGDEVKTEYAAYQGVMANLKSGSFANATRAAGRKVFNLTLKWIYNLNQAGENAMRLAAFRAMIESGKTPAQAAKAAKNITVNFNRKGELGAEANAAYLFFNASVQGVAALAHAHFKGEHKYQAWGLSSMVGVLGYMAAAALLGGDDDEYDKLNDYTKSRNLLIKAGEGYAQIPIPYGYGFFWNMGRSIAEAQHKGELGNLPWHIAASAIEELTPFSDTVVGTQDGFHFDQVMLGLLPTVIKIPAQPAFNKQLFSGSELMPDSAFQQFQPDREKLWRATQGTMYDRMSGWLDEAIGADVSPETLKHYTRTFTGGAGAMVDATVSAAMLKKEGAELEPSEIPFVRKAYSKLTIREHRAAYYKAREEAKKTAEEFTRAKARNDVTTINKLVKDEAEMIGLDAYANKLSKAISAMRDMQDAIRLDDNLNAAEKRTKIKELEITEQKFYDQYLDVFKIEKAKMKERQKD